MLIHAEPSALERSLHRPAHLSSFTVDWHARPGVPLSEAGKLRHTQSRSASSSPHATHARGALQRPGAHGVQPAMDVAAAEQAAGSGQWLPARGAARPFGSPSFPRTAPPHALNKYQSAAQQMVDARVTREQHMEGMRLAFQAERRQEQRAKDSHRTLARQTLELSSGQAIARSKGRDTWPAAPGTAAGVTAGGTQPLVDELLAPVQVLESWS